MARRAFYLLWGLGAFFTARAGSSQDPCNAAPLNLIFQDIPATGPRFISWELFEFRTDSVTVPVRSGSVGSAVLFAAIVSQLDSGRGVESWSFAGVSEGDIRVADATVSGTAAAPQPEGWFRAGFLRLELGQDQAGAPCFLTAVVLTFGLEVITLPTQSTATVLALRVESSLPQGREPVVGKLEIRDQLRCSQDEGGRPFPSVATRDGSTQAFCRLPLVSISFVEDPQYRRGDANSDVALDIADAVRIFKFLFRGAAGPDCLDAADANDDGRLDLTDGVRVLVRLFAAGAPIPAPGPSACGTDPTEDSLSCAAYTPCR
jgi:hypothetical protein